MLTSHLLAILLTPFRDGFTRPTWRKVLILLEGTLLARGRRTVTAALRMMGLHQLTRFNVFHHVLSRARWSPLRMSRVLFLLLVNAGRQACWTKRAWTLPFLCVLLSSPEHDRKLGRRLKTVPDWTGQLVHLLRRWLPDVPMTLVGDGANSSTEPGLTCAKWRVTLIAPLRPDACLYEPLPPNPPRREGRPRVVGERLPKRDHILADPSIWWHTATVNWYGEGERRIEWCSGTGRWNRFRAGRPLLPLRWVISWDPTGQRETRFYFATDLVLAQKNGLFKLGD